MSQTFRAVFRKRTTDKDGAGTITFDYPASEADDVDKIAKKVGVVIYVTVVSEAEYKALCQQHGTPILKDGPPPGVLGA